jgi:hypothetical protein
MDRIRLVVYIPYFGRSHPRYTSFSEAVTENPLSHKFNYHIAKARQCVERLQKKRFEGRTVKDLDAAYYNRWWFIRMSSFLDILVGKIERDRNAAMDKDAFRRYTIRLAMLEIIASLLIFCDNEHYRSLSDEDIEAFRFPLSKWSRTVISSLKIIGDDLQVTSPFLVSL